MSKKPKPKPPPAAAELVHARVLREQRWAFERRRERLRWDQIADLAMRPPAEGGLGYARSPRQLKAAYAIHVAEVVELEEATRPEATTIALATLDAIEREYVSMAGVVDAAATEARKRELIAEGADPVLVADVVVLRSEDARGKALDGVLKVHDRRTKLLGLDAPIAVDVTHHDATIDELNDALGRLGEAPIPTPKEAKVTR